jgi:hypothetical protein
MNQLTQEQMNMIKEDAEVWKIINEIKFIQEKIFQSADPRIIIDRAEYPFEPVHIALLGVVYVYIDADIFHHTPIIRLENFETHAIQYYDTTKEWLEDYRDRLFTYLKFHKDTQKLLEALSESAKKELIESYEKAIKKINGNNA